MITQIAGYTSGVAELLSFYPYVRDIFLGKTKPERASWIIWAVLSLVAFFPQLINGGTYSLFMTGVMAAGDLFVFILAIKYGVGGMLKRDIVALAGLIIGLSVWYFTKEAAFALYIIILIDASGTALTAIKTYQHPKSETASSWALLSLAGIFACVAVGKFNFVLLIWPFYMILAGFTILLAMKYGRKI